MDFLLSVSTEPGRDPEGCRLLEVDGTMSWNQEMVSREWKLMEVCSIILAPETPSRLEKRIFLDSKSDGRCTRKGSVMPCGMQTS